MKFIQNFFFFISISSIVGFKLSFDDFFLVCSPGEIIFEKNKILNSEIEVNGLPDFKELALIEDEYSIVRMM